MIADASQPVSPALWVSPFHSDFLLMAPERSVRASGIFAQISLPAGGARYGDSLFRGAVADAFARARRAGVANPILIGAIPFDQTRPSCLYIPQCHEIFARDALIDALPPAEPPRHQMLGDPRQIPNREAYEGAVAHAVAALARGDADKVVLGRLLDIAMDQPVAPDWLLHRLVQQNPAGFHFRIPLPDGGTLIGASPEQLIRKTGRRVESHPLAGSARRSDDPAQDAAVRDRLAGSAKDAREHGYVTAFMHEVMAPLCATLDVPREPSTLSTATMWHLGTPISGELHDPQVDALQIACALHPTPALCGYPAHAAHQLIRSIEPFEREFFGGIVGWCDGRGDGEWAVAIRCGALNENKVRLFAGAGIVDGSDPASEWRETEAKMTTMLRALGIGIIGGGIIGGTAGQ